MKHIIKKLLSKIAIGLALVVAIPKFGTIYSPGFSMKKLLIITLLLPIGTQAASNVEVLKSATCCCKSQPVPAPRAVVRLPAPPAAAYVIHPAPAIRAPAPAAPTYAPNWYPVTLGNHHEWAASMREVAMYKAQHESMRNLSRHAHNAALRNNTRNKDRKAL